MKEFLRNIKQRIWHALGLYAVYRILRKIDRHFPLKGCRALEAFAFTGQWQAQAYRKLPKYHEAWEILPECEAPLKKNLPDAVIRITDTFEEVKRCDKKFDFINVDNHQGLFGPWCEHFEFFPLLFRVAADDCIVNLNVMPFADEYWRSRYEGLFGPEHLRRRAAFYKTDRPENVSFDQMLGIYTEIAAQHGYELIWHATEKRTLTWYLALHLRKRK